MAEQKVIRCRNCSNAAWKFEGCGFTATESLMCTQRAGEVKPTDGCTFGIEGKPQRAVTAWDVTVGNMAAVHGSW